MDEVDRVAIFKLALPNLAAAAFGNLASSKVAGMRVATCLMILLAKLPLQTATKVVGCVGDSITFGVGASVSDAFFSPTCRVAVSVFDAVSDAVSVAVSVALSISVSVSVSVCLSLSLI